MGHSYNRRILVTDDQPEILDDYLKILSPASNEKEKELASMEADLFGNMDLMAQTSCQTESTFTIATASQGDEAIHLVKQATADKSSFAVAFLDIRMPPGINGVQAAQEIRKIDADIEIVFVTAYSDVSHQEISNVLRAADKWLYLRKPFDADEIKQIALALTEKWNLNKMVKRNREQLRLGNVTTIRALAGLAELRDTDTGNHLKRVAEYSKLIASKLGERKEPKWCRYITQQYVEDIAESSVLHDIGKVGISDSILLKPCKLTTEEFELMKTHTTIGGDVLVKADNEVGVRSFLTLGKEIAYYHHEKFYGTGYPKGLKGEEIPLSARIVALADVYDALTSKRPYREALFHEKAFEIINGEMGEMHFDPVILEAFRGNEGEFKKIGTQYSSSLFVISHEHAPPVSREHAPGL